MVSASLNANTSFCSMDPQTLQSPQVARGDQGGVIFYHMQKPCAEFKIIDGPISSWIAMVFTAAAGQVHIRSDRSVKRDGRVDG